MYSLNILHLYPDILNLYADRGNILALQYCAQKIDVSINIKYLFIGDEFPADIDLILIGGGQDQDQEHVSLDLIRHGSKIKSLVLENLPVLAVCGGYQLFGKSYQLSKKKILEGIGIFDCVSIAEPNLNHERFIGEILINAQNNLGSIIGFENHSARTYLGAQVEPFGHIVKGFGNNGVDSTEGAIFHNAIGTYLHGPILPRNIKLTYFLLSCAIKRKFGSFVELPSENDVIVDNAYNYGVNYILSK